MSATVSDDKPPSRQPRRFPRYPVDIHLAVHVFRPEESVSVWGRSHELGQDGIGGTLELALPMAAGPMKIRALVRYRDGLRHGFEFLALTAGQRQEIQRVCKMLAAAT